MGSLCLFAAGAFCGLILAACCRATRPTRRVDAETVQYGELAESEAETNLEG